MDTQDLQKKLMPEYRSKNPLVRKLFWSRIHKAISSADIKTGFKILDVGCGGGQLLMEISRRYKGVELHGIDVKPEYIEGLKIENCTIKVEDVRSLDFKNKYFDVVFALDTLEHIKHLKKPITEIKRVLKSNGKFIVSAPTETFLFKIGRLLTKGKFSEKDALCSPHYHNAYTLIDLFKKEKLRIIEEINLPEFPVFIKVLKLSKQ